MESEQLSNKEIFELVSTTMKDFRDSMDMTREMSVRIGKRTTQIIRMGMLSVLVLGAVMAYLITTMATDFGRMTENMVVMTGYMHSMEKNFTDVSARLAHMDLTMDVIGQGTTLISSNLNTIDLAVDSMNGAVHDMSGSMRYMSREVHDMSRPMSFFP